MQGNKLLLYGLLGIGAYWLYTRSKANAGQGTQGGGTGSPYGSPGQRPFGAGYGQGGTNLLGPSGNYGTTGGTPPSGNYGPGGTGPGTTGSPSGTAGGGGWGNNAGYFTAPGMRY